MDEEEIEQLDDVEFVVKALTLKLYAIAFCVIGIICLFFAIDRAMEIQFLFTTLYGVIAIVSLITTHLFEGKFKDLMYRGSVNKQYTEQPLKY